MNELENLVREFLAILDIQEESDSGRVFRPNVIRSCRVMDTMRLEKILTRMKELT